MKKILVVLMLALCIAGCRNNQKKVYQQSDLIKQEEAINPQDIDWIGLFIRCHELDSLKKVVEAGAIEIGQPLEALPDSVNTCWDNILSEILHRRGDIAFGIYDAHRSDIEKYLRLDFINYGFITKVYLPYKATQVTREEYGDICIKELETEMAKVRMTMMYTGQTPSHFESLMKDLFMAYVNYDHNEQAMQLCDEIMPYVASVHGDQSLDYANMLNNKASICHKTGSSYSAVIAAKQALAIYDKYLSDGNLDEAVKARITEDKKKLEDKLQLWQGK